MDEASCKKQKSTCLVFILPLLVTESFNKMYKIILLEQNPRFSTFWQDRITEPLSETNIQRPNFLYAKNKSLLHIS